MLTPDIIANIKFYSTENGGRKSAISTNFYGCIFSLEDSKHDCRLLLENIGAVAPGENKKSVPIKFLCADLVIPKIKAGSKFYLWEGGNIAEGVVEMIINTNPVSTEAYFTNSTKQA